jgi:lipopolysaccharide biosynthesis glycosyltransferase
MNEVVFAVNNKYVPMLSVSISTLLKTIKIDIVINILFSNLSANNKLKISRICNKRNTKVNFLPVDQSFFIGLQEMGHLRVESYYRMAIPSLIMADKVLYLDCDILVMKDVSELFVKPIDGVAIAAVEDPLYQPIGFLGMSEGSVYFNSGIMMINLDYWRAQKISEKTLSFLKDNPDKIKYADQCALNAIIDGNFLNVDNKYNFQTGFTSQDSKVKIQPSIVHFTGSIKPTNYLSQHKYKDVYIKELKRTGFYNLIVIENVLRRIVIMLNLYPITNFVRKIISYLKDASR